MGAHIEKSEYIKGNLQVALWLEVKRSRMLIGLIVTRRDILEQDGCLKRLSNDRILFPGQFRTGGDTVCTKDSQIATLRITQQRSSHNMTYKNDDWSVAMCVIKCLCKY